MAMTERDPFDKELDAAFADLRAQAPRPDAALLGRVLDDAAAQAPGRRKPFAWLRGWRGRLAELGGDEPAGTAPGPRLAMPGVAVGLAASLTLGIWIGASLPGVIPPPGATQWSEAMLLALDDPALVLAE